MVVAQSCQRLDAITVYRLRHRVCGKELDKKSQLVLMSLRPGEEIGIEVHDGDQVWGLSRARLAWLDSWP
jgi:mannose-6-phosphate isomerase-like protein (cupin superfamily)